MATPEQCANRAGIALAVSAAISLAAPPAIAQGHGGGGGPSPNPVIVYAEQSNQSKALKLMNADGSNKTVLLANAGSGLPNANWSADGTEIVFTSNRFGVWGICSVRRDGSNLQFIVPVAWDLSAPVCSPVLAPDGRAKILFEDRLPGQNFTDLFLVNVDGTGLVNLTNTPDAAESQPTWAHGADRFAARVGHGSPWRTDIVVYDLGLVSALVAVTGTSNVTDLPGSPLQYVATLASPDWARTNNRIALCAIGSSGQFDLWVIDLATPATPLNLTATASVSEQDPSWSPDDARIVFRRNAGSTTSGLYLVNADGSGLASLNAKGGMLPNWRRQ